MTNWLSLIFKGAAMGAANVIPGVSGGTVAFVTGIYERLIEAVKNCDLAALKLLAKRDWKGFVEKTDFWFLFWLGIGIVASLVTLAKVLEYSFEHHPVLVWALFFGLILASVYFVGNKVKRWGIGPIVGALIGAGIAVAVATLFEPAEENRSIPYLLLCGVIAMASMIIPGLSGSFVLLLLGNYQLVMIDSVNMLRSGNMDALKILIPVCIGAVLGLIVLSHLLSWIFRKFHDLAVALLTGFIAGSLLIIWPWKTENKVKILNPDGSPVLESDGSEKMKTVSYEWNLPEMGGETFFAIGLVIVGGVLVWLMEKFGATKPDAE